MVFPFFSRTSCPVWQEGRICSRQGGKEVGKERLEPDPGWGRGGSNASLHSPNSEARELSLWGGEREGTSGGNAEAVGGGGEARRAGGGRGDRWAGGKGNQASGQ